MSCFFKSSFHVYFLFVSFTVAGGIYQNSVYGIAAKLDYTGAVVLGSVSLVY